MAIIHMVVKIMHRKLIENGLLFLIAIFVFFVSPSLVSAIDYGSGVYNYGLYSATTPTGGHPPLLVPVIPPVTPPIPEGCTSITLFSPINGQHCPSFTTPVSPTTPTLTSYNFGTTTLKLGSTGEAVKELQRFLNDKLNLGLVLDGILGSKTIAVVKQWQEDNGLVADGLVGSKTKAMMNGLTSVSPSTTTNSYNFGTTTLKLGSTGEAVKELQRFLNDKLNLGLVLDGILGSKTIAVVKQWQEDNGLVADGLVGSKTKAMMNAVAQ